jgi:hypothetical protein
MFMKNGVCPHCNTEQDFVFPSLLGSLPHASKLAIMNAVNPIAYYSRLVAGVSGFLGGAFKRLKTSPELECVHCGKRFFECFECNKTTALKEAYVFGKHVNCHHCKKAMMVSCIRNWMDEQFR